MEQFPENKPEVLKAMVEFITGKASGHEGKLSTPAMKARSE